MRKLLSVRNVCLTLIFALALACVSVLFVLTANTAKTPAHADSNGAASAIAETELSAPTTTYIIGDNSIIGTAGAMPVNNDSDTYGWYTYVSVTNTYSYSSHEYGWITAINAPSSADSRVKIMLASDWTATISGKTTSFGTSATSFKSGSLYIPINKYIQLDLNGYVIDRAKPTTAPTYGGVIYVDSNADLELTDSNPTAEHNDGNGNALYTYTDKEVILNDDDTLESAEEVKVEVTGGIITGGYAYYGGGVFVYSGGTFTMTGGEISGNSAINYGGGVYVSPAGTFKMTGGEISGNSVSNSGGGVYVNSYSTFTMTGGEISGNSATNTSGGGVYAHSYITFTMTGGSISGNSAKSSGGGVYVYSNSTFTMTGGSISGNSTTSSMANYGGGVYTSGTFTMTGGEILGNSTTNLYSATNVYGGGGVYVNSSGTFTMDGGKILGNTSILGGGVHIGGTFTMNGGKISGNIGDGSSNGGGGVYIYDSTCTMTGGEISNNSATSGGGVYVRSGTCTMTGGDISGNSATSYGGGVYMITLGTFNMSGGEISNNSASSDGGGVYHLGTFKLSGKPVIKDNKVGDKANNVHFFSSGVKITVTGELEEGASIGVNYTAAMVVTLGYASYNSADGYVVDPSEYFFADSEEYGIALSAAGEVLLLSGADLEYKAGYGENAELSVVDGLSVEYGYEKGYEAEYEITNGNSALSVTVYKDGSDVAYTGSLTQAGVYKLVCNVSSYDVVFTLIIAPKDLSGEDLGITLDTDYCEYDGSEKEPSIVGTLEYDGETLEYDVTYENNKNAGTAYAVVTLKGNYSGEFKVPFTIYIEGGYYQIVWQYYNGTEWANIDSESEITYVPSAIGDQSNRVRAQLTFAGDESIVKYAYANGVSNYLDSGLSSDEISGYYLEYMLGGVVSAFHNAGEYAISIYNDGTETIKLNNNDDKYVNAKTLTVKAFEIAADDEKLSTMVLGEYEFTGAAHTPSVAVVYDNLELEVAVDYILEYYDSVHADSAINGGTAYVRIVFIGNYAGTKVVSFEIHASDNEWVETPNIIRWKYGAFDPESSVIIATPKFILDSETLGVSILDRNGGELVIDGVSLSNITVERVNDADYGWCYVISDEEVVAAINKLEASRYIMRVWLNPTTSYSELMAREITFNIAQNNNYWDETPSIASWTEGSFDDVNLPAAAAHFGNDGLRIVIVDVEDETKVYYDSANGINRLYDLPAGVYYLTATVAGNDNYSELTYSQLFRVLSKSGDTVVNEGLPWWAVLLIILGVLIIIAIVVLILHIKGVFQIITGKMVIAMRSKADVDATIAAVRAGRVAAAYENASSVSSSVSVAEQAKEQAKTEKKAKALEKKAKTPEEKAAELEAKAKAMRKRAEAMKAKAKVIVMTPEEKAAIKAKEKEDQERKAKAKTPEMRAEILEEKARLTEEQAETLKAKAEVMKSRASEMREKAAAKAEREREKAEKEKAEKAEAKAKAKADTKAKAKEKEKNIEQDQAQAEPDNQAETTATTENEEE